jgi:isocitrate dehydrogenase
VLSDLQKLPEDRRAAVERRSRRRYESGPALAQVDSSKGITNLHVPSDVIIDASMPAAFRSSGQMWNASDELQDTKFVIPDSSYAALYDETVKHCREHGAFDPTTMGTTPNVGLMAQKAEEYGSHDKTFEIPAAGHVNVGRRVRHVLLSRTSRPATSSGACQTKDAPSGTGCSWRPAGPRHRRARGVLAGREPGPHDARC